MFSGFVGFLPFLWGGNFIYSPNLENLRIIELFFIYLALFMVIWMNFHSWLIAMEKLSFFFIQNSKLHSGLPDELLSIFYNNGYYSLGDDVFYDRSQFFPGLSILCWPCGYLSCDSQNHQIIQELFILDICIVFMCILFYLTESSHWILNFEG